MSVEANIRTTREILTRNLAIPDYQRPYRWTQENVLQLFQDIRESMESGRREYRIGSIILFKSKSDRYEIVDGQQRVTTILLFLLNVSDKDLPCAAAELRYHENSIKAIRENNAFIASWLKDNTDSENLFHYLLDNCRFAEIVVDDLSEAFQMFDTQNGRGKSLALYNLLKAYHIRAMELNSQDERVRCDRDWETAVQYDATPDVVNDPNVDILDQLFSEQLFKSRLWCRGECGKMFSKDDLGEFKGFTIDKNHPIDFPFQNPFLLQYMTEKFYRNILSGTIGTKSRLATGESVKANPFVNINQPIINGKAFFEFVQTYVELYKKMFIELGSFQLSDFKKFYYQSCLTYEYGKDDAGWNTARNQSNAFRTLTSKTGRTGDGYLREIYKSLCFVLLDKFGEAVLNRYYRTLYRLVYSVRLEKHAVKYDAARVLPTRYFGIIHRAKRISDLLELDKLASHLKEMKFGYCDKIGNDVLARFIQEGK